MFDEFEDTNYAKGSVKPWRKIFNIVLQKKSAKSM